MRRLVLDERGMTVAEVLIAVVIIGVGLVALSSAIPLAAYGIQEGNQLSTATFLANQRLEQIRVDPGAFLGLPPDRARIAGIARSDRTVSR